MTHPGTQWHQVGIAAARRQRCLCAPPLCQLLGSVVTILGLLWGQAGRQVGGVVGMWRQGVGRKAEQGAEQGRALAGAKQQTR